MLDKDIGRLARQYIAQYAAADTGDDADKHQKKGAVRAGNQVRRPDPCDGKYGEPHRIHKKQDRFIDPAVAFKKRPDRRQEQDKRRCQGNNGINRFPEQHRRMDTQHKIPNNAAARRRHQPKHRNSQ